jgi:Ni,Fe-hydrogenase III large subunit
VAEFYRERTVRQHDLPAELAKIANDALLLGCYATERTVRTLLLSQAGVLALRTPLEDGEAWESLTARYPLFADHEREMAAMQGIDLRGSPDLRPLYFRADAIPEAILAEGKGVSGVVVGPVHAGIIEPGRFTISTAGESVVHLDAQLSYSHRALEPWFEGRHALELVPKVARICGNCSVARSWAYARALESLAGIELDEGAEFARLILAEMERVHVHLFDLGNIAAGAGYGKGTTAALGLRERINQLNHAVSGHRLLFDSIVPGGVRVGTLSDPASLGTLLRELRDDVERFLDAFFAKRSVLRRLEGAGVVEESLARRFGAVGPSARASGIACDVRTLAPYGAYRGFTLSEVRAHSGDVYARSEVRRHELERSFDLLERALRELGSVMLPVPVETALPSGTMTTLVEGARGAESVSLSLAEEGRVERLHVISAAFRNWPLVTRAMEGNIVPDFPLVNKSFNLCYSCVDR